MENFTEKQIQEMIWALKNEYCGPEVATRELAILELEDLKRKGCTLENLCECHGCSATKNGECPLCDWEKRHPEYANDELATKIKILEAGGEDAYKKKMEALAEAKKKLEEEQKKKLDYDTLKSKLFDILDDYFINDKYASEAGPLADIVLLIDYSYDRDR